MNTQFPADKADKIAEMFSFTDEEKQLFCNTADDILKTHEDKDPTKIITAVCEYADLIAKSKGTGYIPKIAKQKIGDVLLTSIEPPCGSNTYIPETKEGFLVIDGGFHCYAEELKQTVLSLYPEFGKQKTKLLITHIDMDHMGAMDLFDCVYLNEASLENFTWEKSRGRKLPGQESEPCPVL